MRTQRYKVDIITHKKLSPKRWRGIGFLVAVFVLGIQFIRIIGEESNVSFVGPLLILLSVIGIVFILAFNRTATIGTLYFYSDSVVIEKKEGVIQKEYSDIYRIRFNDYDGQVYYSSNGANYRTGTDNHIWFNGLSDNHKITVRVENKFLYLFIKELFDKKRNTTKSRIKDWSFKDV